MDDKLSNFSCLERETYEISDKKAKKFKKIKNYIDKKKKL